MIRVAFVLVLALLSLPAQAQLRGHGGPVRALAIAPDGKSAISGSFDSSAIRWDLERHTAQQVLRFHESAVNAVAFAPDGRIVTGGEDGRVALWQPGATAPAIVLEGHTAPIVALAVSPDGATLASASWDRSVRLWPLKDGAPRLLEGHQQNVNGVAFTPDGKALVSVSYDLTVRIWPLDGSAPTIVTLPSPLNAVSVARDGEIVTGSADGRVFFLSGAGELRGELAAGETPIIAVAVSNDGALVAAAGIRGSVAIIERAQRTLARTLIGPGLPVWSAAFFPNSRTLLTGGTDRMVRRWNAASGDHIGTVAMAAADDPLSAPASPATRSRPTRATEPARRCPAFSAAGSRHCPATTSRRR
jgi:cytochrome c